MIKLTQNEKSVVSGALCEDGNKCFPWNKVNNYTEIDFDNLWCLNKNNSALFCANIICCTMPMTGKSYDGYTYHGDLFNPKTNMTEPGFTESGYCQYFDCK
ncbi:MAG: hypothetical protein KKE11_01110 [Gammaproteobacteria bacterium]|nr:hypothetical protein [Gammaproteobacteria bacterium]